MPRICRFGGMTIVIYYNDHNPPHIHIINGDLMTRIEIETGEYLKGDYRLPRKQEKDIHEWLKYHMNDIMKAWNDCMAKRPPSKIPPLY